MICNNQQVNLDADTNSTQSSQLKKKKDFNFNNYKTRHIAIHLTYIGIDYNGIQCTLLNDVTDSTFDSVVNDGTIEYQLFKALFKTRLIQNTKDCKYNRCGRTDKGVSAFGQVVDLWVRSNLKDETILYTKREGELDYCRMLNGLLPIDIRCLGWCGVPDDFNSRFSCQSRTYHYYFDPSSYDVPKMKEAAQLFLGEHDFTNFCKKDPAVPHCIRRVNSFEVEEINGLSRFVVCGTAFVWHQVRYMVGALFAIGQGANPESIKQLLDVEHYTKPNYFKYAPAYPLVLYECKYDRVEFLCDNSNVKLLGDLVEAWKEIEIKGMMRKSLMTLAMEQKMSDGKLTVGEKLKLIEKKKIELKPKRIDSNNK
ncbi:tRNA pseudouridine synthase, putative [Entamoeba dispar SAW760]|uniref:tRNA pseudouridine synthase, putative n=1 Tax=Entamoeba dispar (strain ATCC PRA-260 / SAW760) TaxID=370354 RepID=B0E7N4_ENTDS|nr:tRNA pseudouridine synthase, putative [Entamoeba dispar SAW760]EDR29463.1 tRNA pseudouridine synthase, putative [Entamoeba dispar SAW760]|eukprot:EDR29463.1 tRNA pseudouridine synthase, putative [Entamoeba dispar SAW760]